MADRNARLAKNVPGPFYVDSECIGCTQCVTTAEGIFVFDEDSDLAYVVRQPSNPDEEKRARQAMEECPVQAIGDDG